MVQARHKGQSRAAIRSEPAGEALTPAVMAIFGLPVMRIARFGIVEPGRRPITFPERPFEDDQQLAIRRPGRDLYDPIAARQLGPEDGLQSRRQRRRPGDVRAQ